MLMGNAKRELERCLLMEVQNAFPAPCGIPFPQSLACCHMALAHGAGATHTCAMPVMCYACMRA